MIPPKIAAPLLIVIGIAMCWITLHLSGSEGVVKLAPSLCGPMAIIFGIGMAVLPENKLFLEIGTKPNGEPVYDYRAMSSKPHYIGLVTGSIAAGILFTALIFFGII